MAKHVVRPPRIVDRDLGYKRIAKTLAVRQPHVEVGVMGDEEYPGGLTTAAVAVMHEFGGEEGNPPERSFLRSTVDENRDKYVAILRKFAELVLLGAIPAQIALGRFGLVVVADIKQTIRDGIPPELAPSTIARKGENKSIPLIDTAQFFNSIASRVVEA